MGEATADVQVTALNEALEKQGRLDMLALDRRLDALDEAAMSPLKQNQLDLRHADFEKEEMDLNSDIGGLTSGDFCKVNYLLNTTN